MTGIEDLYREIILDHYRSPRNRGELESPPAERVEGFNPLCGDEVVVTLEVNEDVVSDIKIAGTGCSISQSSASLMSAAVKGKPVPEVRELIRTFKGMMSIHESTLPSDNGNSGDGPVGLAVAPDPRPSTSIPSESSPPSRASSSSRYASSAPPSAGTRWPRGSTRAGRPAESTGPAVVSAGGGVEVGLDGGGRAGRRRRSAGRRGRHRSRVAPVVVVETTP